MVFGGAANGWRLAAARPCFLHRRHLAVYGCEVDVVTIGERSDLVVCALVILDNPIRKILYLARAAVFFCQVGDLDLTLIGVMDEAKEHRLAVLAACGHAVLRTGLRRRAGRPVCVWG